MNRASGGIYECGVGRDWFSGKGGNWFGESSVASEFLGAPDRYFMDS